jgi:phosphoserine phosphatase RsbX
VEVISAEDIGIAIINKPIHGEKNSGDLPLYYLNRHDLLLVGIDGLGHGKKAHEATLQVKKYLDFCWHCDLVELLNELHLSTGKTIGAAISLAHVNLLTGEIKFVGLGNVFACIFGESKTVFVSRDGILGKNKRTPLLQTHTLKENDIVILASDGISSGFYRDNNDFFMKGSLTFFAHHLLRKYGKIEDDASCLIFRFKPCSV